MGIDSPNEENEANNLHDKTQNKKSKKKLLPKLLVGLGGVVGIGLLGVSYYNYTNTVYCLYGVIDADRTYIEVYNHNFTQYMGNNIRKDTLSSLLDEIITNNQYGEHKIYITTNINIPKSYSGAGDDLIINYDKVSDITEINLLKKNISNTHVVKFLVEKVDADEDGYIKEIKISTVEK